MGGIAIMFMVLGVILFLILIFPPEEMSTSDKIKTIFLVIAFIGVGFIGFNKSQNETQRCVEILGEGYVSRSVDNSFVCKNTSTRELKIIE